MINDGSSSQSPERTHFLSSVQSSWETLCAVAAGTFWSLAYLKNTHPHSSVIIDMKGFCTIGNKYWELASQSGVSLYLLSRRSNTCLVVAKER